MNVLKQHISWKKYLNWQNDCENWQRESDHEKVFGRSEECIREILEDKKQYILKMTNKLKDAVTAPKIC